MPGCFGKWKNGSALPDNHATRTTCARITVQTLSRPLPDGFQFFIVNESLDLISEGKTKPVIGLQRHPLINSIFPRPASPKGKAEFG
jgi:hypothetical protein